MSVQDLKTFLYKVEQLNQLVKMISEYPERKILLSKCTNHNEVVELAAKWGLEIGRRWGE